AEVLAAVLRDQPADMDAGGTRCPTGLKSLVARCLAKRPDDRIPSAADVATALRQLAAGGGDQSEPAGPPASPARPGVGVLPVQNLSANRAETDYVADGLTDVLTAELAKNRALRVVSRTTTMRFQDGRTPLRQIAREFGADVVVEGSLLLAGGSVRVTTRL